MRTILAHIDWNDNIKNKMGEKGWNILKSELDSVINIYIPMKKQGKHLSKEAFKKSRYKQDMWRVYKHTG